ncbi:MAG: nuclear transport factor 2 family protein [Cyanobacteria bacterium P01_F01_bin.150]
MGVPTDTVMKWVRFFNQGDADAIAGLYAIDAVVEGRQARQQMFHAEFVAAEMECLIENLLEDGEWAILEWRAPNELRGCGFFHITNGKIQCPRGYWYRRSFLRLQGLPIPDV